MTVSTKNGRCCSRFHDYFQQKQKTKTIVKSLENDQKKILVKTLHDYYGENNHGKYSTTRLFFAEIVVIVLDPTTISSKSSRGILAPTPTMRESSTTVKNDHRK